MTTFWQDFSIADHYGIAAIRDTYNRAKKEWAKESTYEYWTELVLVLNHKLWQAYYAGNTHAARLYDRLWRDAQDVVDTWTAPEAIDYYYRTTD